MSREVPSLISGSGAGVLRSDVQEKVSFKAGGGSVCIGSAHR